MSFFKKQSFKIKDLLKEKNIKLSLVSVQEILAKSYGFNNRHVLLNQEDHINNILNQIHKNKNTKSLVEMCKNISRKNFKDVVLELYKRTDCKIQNVDSNITNYIIILNNKKIAININPIKRRIREQDIIDIKNDMIKYDCEEGIIFTLNGTALNPTYYLANNNNISIVDKEYLMHMVKRLEKESITNLENLPSVITKENIKNLEFWWSYGDMPSHYPDSDPGSPFDEDYGFEDKYTFTIYEHQDKTFYNDKLLKNKLLVKDLCRWLGEEQIKQNNFEINFSSEDFIHDINIPNDQKEKIYNHILELQKMLSNYSKTYTTKKKVLAPTKIVYQYNKKDNVFIKLQKEESVIKEFAKNKGYKPTIKAFNEISLYPGEINYLLNNSTNWKDEIKHILLHKNCPKQTLKEYGTTHKDWYVRLTALFGKHHRNELHKYAIDDPDPRVRKAYYEYLIQFSDLSLSDISKKIKKDKGVFNFFKNMEIEGKNILNY